MCLGTPLVDNMKNSSDEETDHPHYADRPNFSKVEPWTRDGMKVDGLL